MAQCSVAAAHRRLLWGPGHAVNCPLIGVPWSEQAPPMLWLCSVRSMSCAATGSDEWEALITLCVGYLYNETALLILTAPLV